MRTWILLFGLFLAVMLAFFRPPLEGEENPIAFEREGWQKARASDDERTLNAMSSDLIAKINSQKPALEEVINQLGKPEIRSGNAHFRYDLRSQTDLFGLALRRHWLSISFEHGHAVVAEKVPD